MTALLAPFSIMTPNYRNDYQNSAFLQVSGDFGGICVPINLYYVNNRTHSIAIFYILLALCCFEHMHVLYKIKSFSLQS